MRGTTSLFRRKTRRRKQKKLDNEVEKRKHQSAAERAKLDKERLEEQKYLREFTEAFDFKVIGEEPVSGKPAWVISVNSEAGISAQGIRSEDVYEAARQGLDR